MRKRTVKGVSAAERLENVLKERGAVRDEELKEGQWRIVGVYADDVLEVLKTCPEDDPTCQGLRNSVRPSRDDGPSRVVHLQAEDVYHILDKHGKKTA